LTAHLLHALADEEAYQFLIALAISRDLFGMRRNHGIHHGFYGANVGYLPQAALLDNLGRVPATGQHGYEAVPAVEPTCASVGWTKGAKCPTCDEKIWIAQEEIPALPHTEVILPAVEPTCGETGLTEGKTCSVCKSVLVEQELIRATGEHTYEIIPETPATCSAAGLTSGIQCSVCKLWSREQTVVPALPHTKTVLAAKDATCSEPGLTEGEMCSVCEEILVAQEEIPATGEHTPVYVEEAKAPTCTEDGYTAETLVCADCGKILTEASIVYAPGHTVVTVEGKAPTCTETGLTDGSYCSVCEEILTEQEEIPATGEHQEETLAAVEPTCALTGLTEGKKCSVCNEVLVAQEEIPATGDHGYVVVPAVEATCSSTGLTKGAKCPNCDVKVWIAQTVVPALPHTEEVIPAVEPTCTETGLTEGKKCSVCGEILTEQEEVSVAPHQDVSIPAVEPTCTETGLTEGKKCSVCGFVSLEQEVVPTAPHTEEVIPAVDATCTEAGLTEGKKCSVCDAVLTEQEETPLAEHTPVFMDEKLPTCTEPGYAADTLVCSVCGEILLTEGTTPATGHTPGDAVIKNEVKPDCTTGGSYDSVVYCAICDEELDRETVTTEALGHTEGEPVIDGRDTVVSCSVCGEELSRVTTELIDADTFKTTMGLENALNVMFGVPVDALSDWTGVYAKVVKEVAGSEPVTKIIPAEDWGFISPYFAIEFSGVAGKEMADKFTLQLFDANNTAISTVKEDSVRDYALRAYENTTEAVRRTMFIDMLNYGAAAQEYFKYNTDNLANAGLTEEQLAYATKTDDVTLSDCQVTEGSVKGTTLDLGSRILIMVGVNGADETCYATYSYTDHYGRLQEGRIEGEDFGDLGGVTAINMDMQVLADARQPFTLEVWNAEDELVASVYDSLESYICRALAKYESDLFVAIMKFADAAYAMLHA